ncbi:hypothetical protein ONV78_00920 [Hahella sp. CR1]|uniref:hypothetical protein n=1 Tax=Hahella sp. CR1 TaxID=2992807 RepID=UPI002443444B|nr:hypothetical protein [Hahella sp. CR1]MDG9666274.1 hypothetical protein [Hahella sp. CR1]
MPESVLNFVLIVGYGVKLISAVVAICVFPWIALLWRRLYLHEKSKGGDDIGYFYILFCDDEKLSEYGRSKRKILMLLVKFVLFFSAALILSLGFEGELHRVGLL